MLDTERIKQDFPILWRKVHAKPLVFLDNAATSQKPRRVIEAIVNYYENHNANVHRGVHQLSDESTDVLETSRERISKFFGAKPSELIFTRNSTGAINGVAYGWADHHLGEGDIILTSVMEHHSNIVVWQQVAARTGAQLEYVEVTEDGILDIGSLKKHFDRFGKNIKLISLTQVSNTLGTVNPIGEIVMMVRDRFTAEQRPRIMVDGAQAASHLKINFDGMGVDFFTFSGHKMLGPMGVGGLLVRNELLQTEEMRPWLFGGGMIASVQRRSTEFHQDPIERFTAGTPDVASIAGLAAATDYLTELGMENITAHDLSLVEYTLKQLESIEAVTVVGPKSAGSLEDPKRIGSVSFIYNGVHAHDVAQVLDSEGVAVRSGHHCTMPLHQEMNWQATIRVSFQVYNSTADIESLISALNKVSQVFKQTKS